MQICAISREKKSYLGNKTNTMSTERKHKTTSLGKKKCLSYHISQVGIAFFMN